MVICVAKKGPEIKDLGQWLSRPVWCKSQRGKDDTLVMKFEGSILEVIWASDSGSVTPQLGSVTGPRNPS